MMKGQYGKRTKWSMAEMVKDQMLEAEMAKDEMGEDEVDINRAFETHEPPFLG